MMQTVTSSGSWGAAPIAARFPPVKPRWLTPTTTLLVALAHIGAAVLFTTIAIERFSPLEAGVNVELIPEGDTMESEAAAAMDISQPKPEQPRQAELAIPPPQLMTPDAIPLPLEKKAVEPKKHVERKQIAPSDRRQEASERHRLGVAGGRAAGMSRASYAGLLAAAIARHVPSVSSLGPGTASCTFHVGPSGGMGGVSCSGSSGSHASLLRSAIYATRAPPPPGGAFFGSQTVHFR